MSIPINRRSRAVRPSPVFLLVIVLTAVGGAFAWDAPLDSTRAKAGVFVFVVFGWVVTLCLHEFAHAYTAWRAGDREVELRGYLTLNPLKYSHPLLSIVLPMVFIALGGSACPAVRSTCTRTMSHHGRNESSVAPGRP